MNERPGRTWRRTAAAPPDGYGVDTLAPPEAAPDREPLPSWFRRGVVYVGFVVLAFLFGAWVFTQLGGFWPIMAFAFFIGLAIEPIVNYLERRGLRRGAGTGLVLVSLIVGTIAFFGIFGNLLVTQLIGLVQDLPSIIDAVFNWSNAQFGTDLDFETALDTFGVSASDLAGVATELGAGIFAAVLSAFGVLFAGAAMLLFAFYFAADGPKLRRTVASWLPPARQRVFYTVWTISANKAGTYVISRGILALISAAVSAVFFAIIGLDYWLPLALWVGFVSQFIPTIGTYLAGALPVVIALTQGSPWIALAVVVFIVAYQQIENMVLTPRVTQQTLEVHAAVAFGSVLVGGILFGATGALLAIPVVAIVQAVLETYGKRYTLVPDLHQFEVAAAGGNANQLPTTEDVPDTVASPPPPEAAQEVAAGSAPP